MELEKKDKNKEKIEAKKKEKIYLTAIFTTHLLEAIFTKFFS